MRQTLETRFICFQISWQYSFLHLLHVTIRLQFMQKCSHTPDIERNFGNHCNSVDSRQAMHSECTEVPIEQPDCFFTAKVSLAFLMQYIVGSLCSFGTTGFNGSTTGSWQPLHLKSWLLPRLNCLMTPGSHLLAKFMHLAMLHFDNTWIRLNGIVSTAMPYETCSSLPASPCHHLTCSQPGSSCLLLLCFGCLASYYS
jgi:hypothetical protein